jgi:ribonuclease D
VFIDKIDEKFNYAKDILTKAEFIGLDCEFTSGYTKFHKHITLNLIQLSTHDKIFLFDSAL